MMCSRHFYACRIATRVDHRHAASQWRARGPFGSGGRSQDSISAAIKAITQPIGSTARNSDSKLGSRISDWRQASNNATIFSDAAGVWRSYRTTDR